MNDFNFGYAVEVSTHKKVVKFTASGVWTVPADVEVIEAVIVGGGGSGGFCSQYAGGGGGGCIRWQKIPVVGLSSIPVVVGVGGAALTAVGDGNDGGDSYVLSDIYLAPGGKGGKSYQGASAAIQGGYGGGFSITDVVNNTYGVLTTTSGGAMGNEAATASPAVNAGIIRSFGWGAYCSGGQGGHGYNSAVGANGGSNPFGNGGTGLTDTQRLGGGGASFGPGGDYGSDVPAGSIGGGSGAAHALHGPSGPGANGAVYIFY